MARAEPQLEKSQRAQKRLQTLFRQYATSLPARLEEIEKLCDALDSDVNDSAVWTSLHRLAHKLAGSGGIFGLEEFSDAAGRLEAIAAPIVHGEHPPVPQDTQRVRAHVRELRESAPPPSQKATAPERLWPADTDEQPAQADHVLYVLDKDDAGWTELLPVMTDHGYDVRLFSDIPALNQAIDESAPQVALLDAMQLRSSGTRTELLRSVREIRARGGEVIFCSDHDDLKVRLEAARAGGHSFLAKPFHWVHLLEKLGTVTTDVGDPYRVLIIDDDGAPAAVCAWALERAGMTCVVVTDTDELFDRAAEFGPEIILMDMHMPDCTGLELASVLRQDERFIGAPIIFLTSDTEIARHMDALSAGADDFLNKSVSADRLISAVSSRVRRARVVRSLMERDHLTGLLSSACVHEEVEREIARARRYDFSLAFALIEVDDFSQLSKSHGYAFGDAILRHTSAKLVSRLRRTDIAGRDAFSRFLILFTHTRGADAQRVLTELGQNLASSPIALPSANAKVALRIVGAVAEWRNGLSVGDLRHLAEETLQHAKQSGEAQIVLAPVADSSAASVQQTRRHS